MGDGRSSPRLAAPNVQDAKRAVSSPVRCRGPGPRTTRRVAWRPPARVAAKQAQRAQGGFSCLAPIHAFLRQTRQRMDCYGNANAGVASQPLSIISIPWQLAAPQVRNLDQAGEQMTARRLAQLRARTHAIGASRRAHGPKALARGLQRGSGGSAIYDRVHGRVGRSTRWGPAWIT